MKVTEHTTMDQILSAIGWQDRPYLVNPVTEFWGPDPKAELRASFGKEDFGALTIGDLGNIMSGWNLDSMVSGLNHLVSRCSQAQVLYPLSDSSYLMAFPAEKRGKCVILCPGGGYFNVCSLGEGFPVAQVLNAMGIGVFIVHYRANQKAAAPNPMDDLAAAVRMVQEHAGEWNADLTDYAVMGFSAGGHLAASFGTTSLGWAHYGLPAPGFMLLGYPVITMGEFTHEGSRYFLLGENPEEAVLQRYSIEKQVDARYPATYIWQCAEDCVVPIENSRMMVEALETHHVPCTYEVFPGTAHGWGLGVGTAAEGWLERAVAVWLG